MDFDFDNPPLASPEYVSDFKPEELRGFCRKSGGSWHCIAYVERGDKITVCAVSYGKSQKKVARECMTNAIERVIEGASKSVD